MSKTVTGRVKLNTFFEHYQIGQVRMLGPNVIFCGRPGPKLRMILSTLLQAKGTAEFFSDRICQIIVASVDKKVSGGRLTIIFVARKQPESC